MGKAERTSQYILDKVAPIFNKKGYSATSLSDLTEATGLTKGAIYGNFESKEELALQAFKHNARFLLNGLGRELDAIASPLSKLFAMTNFYRDYYRKTIDYGGCPILNVGIDSNHQNKPLFDKVSVVIDRLQKNLDTMIQDGIDQGELREDLDVKHYGRLMFSMIQGSIFLAVTRKNEEYILNTMDQIDEMIRSQMIKTKT